VKYLLSIYTDETGWERATPEELAQTLDAYGAFSREVEEKGVFLAGEGLEPTAAATTVRVRDGERLVTDGPFAETKEQLGGFYLLECENLDEAIEWAAKIPGAHRGSVEVRPVMNYEMPGQTASAGAEAQRAR
jgi:hypothetical protein